MRDYSNSQFESRPLQGSVVDLVNQNEQFNANRRAEKLEKEKFQYLKDENYQRRIDSFLTDNKSSFENISVKNADLQTFYSNNAYGAMEEIGLLANELRNESRDKRLDPERMAKLTSLNNSVEYLKGITTSFTPIIDQINSGQVHDSPELRALLGDVRNIKVDFKTGYPRVALKSENGNVKYVGIEELSRGIEGLKLVPKADVIKGWDEFTKEIKASVNTTDKNYMQTTTTGVPPEVAERIAENYVFGKGGTIPNGVKSYLYENNFDPYTSLESQPGAKEALIKLQETLAQRLINTRENGIKEDFDWSAQNSANSLAETKRHNRVSESISQQNANTSAKNAETSRMKEGLNGITLGELTKADNTSMSVATKTFGPLHNYRSVVGGKVEPGTLKDSKGTVYEDPVVLGYTYDKKTNSLILDIEYNEGTERMDNDGNVIKGKKNRTAIKVGKATEGRVASLLSGDSESLRKSIISEDTKPKIDY